MLISPRISSRIWGDGFISHSMALGRLAILCIVRGSLLVASHLIGPPDYRRTCEGMQMGLRDILLREDGLHLAKDRSQLLLLALESGTLVFHMLFRTGPTAFDRNDFFPCLAIKTGND